MQNALISVYNKAGIVEFARALIGFGINIYSSGGTAAKLLEHGLPVTDVSEIIRRSQLRVFRALLDKLEVPYDVAKLDRLAAEFGKPILGDRVKTLSREVHAGLLARNIPEDIAELEALGIPRLDLVCCDFYPLEEEISRTGATRESVIEKTDIGGPTMVRSAAKGRRVVLCRADQREDAIVRIREGRDQDEAYLDELVGTAEAAVAVYCLSSARYHSRGKWDGMIGQRVQECRYGENAWQTPAGLFTTDSTDTLALDRFTVLEGAAPSYNNWCDIDRLVQTMTHVAAGFGELYKGETIYAAIGAKHGNPCGAAVTLDPDERASVLRRMVQGSRLSIFGGLVMTNFPLDAELLGELFHGDGERLLLDGVIAPWYLGADTTDAFKRKGGKCRFLYNPALGELTLDTHRRFRYVRGGFLAQPNYIFVPSLSAESSHDLRTICSERMGDYRRDLVLAWAIGSTSNSNTITLVKDGMLIGNGVGQQDRVSCCELAIKRARDAGHDPNGAVAYSDSFFPFEDGAALLAAAGISAVLTSSGSIHDDAVIAAFRANEVEVLLIPDAQGRGFFAH